MNGEEVAEFARLDARMAALEAAFRAEVRRLDGDIASAERLADSKFVTQKTMLEAQAAQVKIALESSEKAILKSETAIDKRFDGVNEFRAALADLAADMATRRELTGLSEETKNRIDGAMDALAELRSRIDVGPEELRSLRSLSDVGQGRQQGISAAAAILISAATLLIALVGIVVAVIVAMG